MAENIDGIQKNEERLIIATGRYLGEGFDDARLDTLFLALPVSWRGVLAQFAGRLHRFYDMKKEVLIYDYADLGVPMLAKMYERRRAGYKAIGYEIDEKFVCVLCAFERPDSLKCLFLLNMAIIIPATY